MPAWRALLIVYRAIELPGGFSLALDDEQVGAAVASFRRFPPLASECSGGEAVVRAEVAGAGGPLRSLTPMGGGLQWPSPDDTRDELDRLAPAGAWASLFVLWPQRDLETGEHVPTGGWGLAIGATEWSNGATYAAVANAEPSIWRRPVVGEVWLHEWLHGVCDHFARRGHEMPPGDADGGGRAGYAQSPTDGWCAYYRDLMTGRVRAGDRMTGIPADAWRRRS